MFGESRDEPPCDTSFDRAMKSVAKFFEGDEDTGTKITDQLVPQHTGLQPAQESI